MEVPITPLPLDPDLHKLLDIGACTEGKLLQHTQHLRNETQRLLNVEANLDDNLHQMRLADVEMRNAMIALLEVLRDFDAALAAPELRAQQAVLNPLRGRLAGIERYMSQAKVHLLS